jgi:hypothetical protein
MWMLAAGIFAACKWLTWRRTAAPAAPSWRHVAYLLAWPGLDAKAFLDPGPLPSGRRPGPGEWTFALAKTALGAVLMWGVVRVVPEQLPILRGWVGMAGVIFLPHFGTFHLLSCAWRAAGVDAKPLMNWPVRRGISRSEWRPETSPGLPLTCDTVVDQDGRGRRTGLRHERLDRNRTHRFVPSDAPSVPFPFDSVQSR